MLNELAKEIHENAAEHGWWDEERSFGDVVALCHSELSEALEEYRNGRPLCYAIDMDGPDDVVPGYETDPEKFNGRKPEGVAVEMADCIIRILDWCGKENVDIDSIIREKNAYNKGRPYRHGGKKL